MNLVLASIYELGPAVVEPFFRSLRHSGYDDAVVAVVMNISSECRTLLQHYRVTIVDVEYRGLPLTYASLGTRLRHAPRAIWGAYCQPRGHRRDPSRLLVNSWRYVCYRDYLANLTEKPQFILMADVRDVVFQSNPFAYPFPAGLSVASECVRSSIGSSRGNAKWLWEVAGIGELRRLSGRTPICSGTTVGDYATIQPYLELMTTHLRRKFFWGMFDAIDQGLHNYFVHNQMVAPLRIYTNWNGPFLTLDSEVVSPEQKNPEGFLCNRDGSVVPIVHQYDRIKNLYRPGEPRPECWQHLP